VCRGRTYGKSDMCVVGGTPYFMEQIGSRIYVTTIFGCSSIISFLPSGNDVLDVRVHFNRSPPYAAWTETLEDVERRGTVW
jgi:hypothetical protein